jgi:hypothetical protein
MTINNKVVKGWDGLLPLFTNCLEEVFSETAASRLLLLLLLLLRRG